MCITERERTGRAAHAAVTKALNGGSILTKMDVLFLQYKQMCIHNKAGGCPCAALTRPEREQQCTHFEEQSIAP